MKNLLLRTSSSISFHPDLDLYPFARKTGREAGTWGFSNQVSLKASTDATERGRKLRRNVVGGNWTMR